MPLRWGYMTLPDHGPDSQSEKCDSTFARSPLELRLALSLFVSFRRVIQLIQVSHFVGLASLISFGECFHLWHIGLFGLLCGLSFHTGWLFGVRCDSRLGFSGPLRRNGLWITLDNQIPDHRFSHSQVAVNFQHVLRSEGKV